MRGGKEETLKSCFLGGAGGIVHYFNDIRQGALQFDCVMILGGS